jgi:hypothetical protein
MIKIKLSYKHTEDLNDMISLLGNRVVKVENEPAKGGYKRAYILAKVVKPKAM